MRVLNNQKKEIREFNVNERFLRSLIPKLPLAKQITMADYNSHRKQVSRA